MVDSRVLITVPVCELGRWKLLYFRHAQNILNKVSLNLVNQTDRVFGPFEVWLSESNTLDEKKTLGEVQEFSSLEFQLHLIPVKNGIQKISGITVLDTIEKKTYDSLLELEDMLKDAVRTKTYQNVIYKNPCL